MFKINKLSQIMRRQCLALLVVLFCFLPLIVFSQPMEQELDRREQQLSQVEGFTHVKGLLLEEENKLLREEVARLKGKISLLGDQIASLRGAPAATVGSVDINSELISLRKEKDYLQGLLDQRLSEIQDLQVELNKLSEGEGTYRGRLSAAERQAEGYKSKFAARESDSRSEIRRLRDENADLKKVVEEYKSSVDTSLTKLRKTEDQNKVYAKKISSLEKEVEQDVVPLRIKLATLNKENKDLTAKLSRAQAERDGWLSKANTLQNSIDVLNSDKRSLAYEANELEQRVKSLKKFVREKKKYENKIKELEIALTEQKGIVNEKEISLKRRQKDLVKLESIQRTHDVEVTRLEKGVEERERTVTSLKDNLRGLENEKKSIEASLREVQVLDGKRAKEINDLEQKAARLKIEKNEFMQEVQDLSAQLNLAQRVVFEREALRKELDISQITITRLEAEKNGFMQEIRDLSARLSDLPKLNSENQALNKRIEQLEAKAQSYEDILARRSKEVEEYRRSTDDLQRELRMQKASVGDVEKLRSDKLEAERKITNLESTLKLLDSKVSEYENLIRKRSDEVAVLQSKTERQTKELEERKREIASTFDEMDALKRDKEEAEKAMAGLGKTLDLIENRHRAQISVYEGTLTELDTKVKEYEATIDERGIRLGDLEGQGRQWEGKLRDLQDEKEDFNRLLAQRGEEVGRLTEEKDLLDKQLAESRSSLNQTLKDLATARRQAQDSEREAESLEGKVDSLSQQLDVLKKKRVVSSEVLEKELEKAKAAAEDYKVALDNTSDELESLRKQSQQLTSEQEKEIALSRNKVDTLSRQAEAEAKNSEILQKELQEAKLAVKDYKAALDEASDKLDGIGGGSQKLLEEKEKEIALLGSKADSLGQQLEEKGASIESLEGKLKDFEATVKDYKAALDDSSNELELLRKQDQRLLAQNEKEIESLDRKVDSLSRQLEAIKKRKAMSSEALQKELQVANDSVKEYKNALDNTSNELERLRKQNQEYEGRVIQLQATVNSLGEKLSGLQEINGAFKAQANSLMAVTASLQKVEAENTAHLKEIASLETKEEGYKSVLTNQNKEISRLNEKFGEQDETTQFLEKSLQYLQVEHDELLRGNKDLKERYENEIASLVAENKHLRRLLGEVE